MSHVESELNNGVDEKLTAIIQGIKEAQETSDRNSKEIEALDKEKISRINEVVTKNLDEINAARAKAEKMEETLTALEKLAARPSNAKEEKSTAAKIELVKYMRLGTQPTRELQYEIAQQISKQRLVYGEKYDIDLMAKSLVEGNNPSGGYWLIPELADFVISREFETSPIRSISKSMQISSESVDIIIDDEEFEGAWVGEVDPRPVTANGEIGQLSIFAHELHASPRASQRMIDDAGFDLPAYIMTKVREIFERKENTAFVLANDAKRPRGFLTYPASADPDVYEREKIGQLNSGTNGEFDADILIRLQNLVKEPYQPNAVWLMHRSTFGTVMTLKTVDGAYLLNPGMIAQGAPKVLIGNPVVFASDMPKAATNSLSIVFGDFRVGYTVVDRLGIRFLRDPFTDQPFIKFRTTKRVGGDVTNYDSFKILKLAA